MNFLDWGELCISSQNQRRDFVGEVVACTGEHISCLYIPEMCCTIPYVSYLDSIVNFRHFIYMLVNIFFFIVFSFCSVVSMYCIGLCCFVKQNSRFWFPYFYVHVCVYSLFVLLTSDHKKKNAYILNVFIVYLYLIFFRIP